MLSFDLPQVKHRLCHDFPKAFFSSLKYTRSEHLGHFGAPPTFNSTLSGWYDMPVKIGLYGIRCVLNARWYVLVGGRKPRALREREKNPIGHIWNMSHFIIQKSQFIFQPYHLWPHHNHDNAYSSKHNQVNEPLFKHGFFPTNGSDYDFL